VAGPIRVGGCSGADATLTKVWYPRGVRSAEDRLRHYAERFDVVEANSTYYRLPEPPMVERWAERTPAGFTMHVKAFGAMTRHPVKLVVVGVDRGPALARILGEQRQRREQQQAGDGKEALHVAISGECGVGPQ
jgi:uncharacterized protein YecE (DUF72 family)